MAANQVGPPDPPFLGARGDCGASITFDASNLAVVSAAGGTLADDSGNDVWPLAPPPPVFVAIARNWDGSLLRGTNSMFNGPPPKSTEPPLIALERCTLTDSTAEGRISVLPFLSPPTSECAPCPWLKLKGGVTTLGAVDTGDCGMGDSVGGGLAERGEDNGPGGGGGLLNRDGPKGDGPENSEYDADARGLGGPLMLALRDGAESWLNREKECGDDMFVSLVDELLT